MENVPQNETIVTRGMLSERLKINSRARHGRILGRTWLERRTFWPWLTSRFRAAAKSIQCVTAILAFYQMRRDPRFEFRIDYGSFSVGHKILVNINAGKSSG